jgi:two-component system chemotaxis sensor kinase CheA
VNNPDHANQLFASLGAELRQARAGSSDGQFPILDLFGNLRDEAAGKSELASIHSACAGAWEKMVGIVESGQPFSQENVEWLNALLAQIENPVSEAPEAPPGLGVRQPSGALESSATPNQERQETAAVQDAPAPAGNLIAVEMELNLNIASDADLLREFITESREHLDNIEQGVLVLEKEPANAEMLNTVFRAFHTFKGGAGFLNLVPINRLAHILESLLDLARQGRFTIASPTIEIILRGRDVLKQFLDAIDGQVSGGKPAVPILIPTE